MSCNKSDKMNSPNTTKSGKAGKAVHVWPLCNDSVGYIKNVVQHTSSLEVLIFSNLLNGINPSFLHNRRSSSHEKDFRCSTASLTPHCKLCEVVVVVRRQTQRVRLEGKDINIFRHDVRKWRIITIENGFGN